MRFFSPWQVLRRNSEEREELERRVSLCDLPALTPRNAPFHGEGGGRKGLPRPRRRDVAWTGQPGARHVVGRCGKGVLCASAQTTRGACPHTPSGTRRGHGPLARARPLASACRALSRRSGKCRLLNAWPLTADHSDSHEE